MNFESNKTSDPRRLLINLSDKTSLKRNECWKNIKTSYKNIKFKIPAPRGMKNLNYLMDHILYQIFQIISSTLSKNMKQ